MKWEPIFLWSEKKTASFIRQRFAIPHNAVTIEDKSVLVVDDKGRRWRLPLGDDKYRSLTDNGLLRVCREVATERDLFSCMGTFYELPAENADGYAKIRPVSTHNYRINDYASYRGMLVMSGTMTEDIDNKHIITSNDGKAKVWVGVIDDLWSFGKPSGHGGPWKNDNVKAGVPSDPYLIAFYDKKELTITHKSDSPVGFTVEVDPTGNGDWMTYTKCRVEPGKSFTHKFPAEFQGRWIRFVADKDVNATALLEYN